MFTEQNVELSWNHPIWCGSAYLSQAGDGWAHEGLLHVLEKDVHWAVGCWAVGSSRAKYIWLEHQALFSSDPPIRASPREMWCAVEHVFPPCFPVRCCPSPHSAAGWCLLPDRRKEGRKVTKPQTHGITQPALCKGGHPVQWPAGWEVGELRLDPRFPNPGSKAFIHSVLACVVFTT